MHPDFVSHVRAQVADHGNARHYVYLREVARNLIEDRHSYADLDRQAREIAVWLAEQPASKHPVLLLFKDGIDFLPAFLGCLYAGVIAVPAPVPHDQRSVARVAAIMRDADARLVLTGSEIQPFLQSAVGDSVRCVATDGAALADAQTWVMPQLDSAAVAFLQYTSGSTSAPKGVMVTHRNLLHNIATIRAAVGAADMRMCAGWLPHFHDMGLIGMMLLPLFTGFNLAFMSPLTFLKRPHRWLTMIDRYRADITVAPDFAYDLVARRVTDEQLSGVDLSSVRVALNAAEPIRPRTLAAFAHRLTPVGLRPGALLTAYGMAEATLLATASEPGAGPILRTVDPVALEANRFVAARGGRTLVSSGRPAGVEIRIVDPTNGKPLEDGHVGEIWMRGPSVAAGYWNRPAETAETFGARIDGDGPYLRTGDLGVCVDGEIFVTGRLKDLLIINGRNIYPQDIEEVVRESHPALRDATGVVLAVEAAGQERVVVVHELKTELLPALDVAALARQLKSTVARSFDIAAPSVVFVGRRRVHRTTSGKVQRRSMLAAFLANELDCLHEEIDPIVQRLRHQSPTYVHA
ncbi:fatty acyl-AMP ligase [Skermania sp. ID1734]|uniref:fatty acyl-AMP ligase n=1 Tax=Skermania sp. ID1734 TaxID=2597516 RepID=UPI001180A516|nr:fatty acyl-AMP ligase [Skermania sp. ID1734]TSE01536.1 fatty acyl-AMP ligase [Skermania sp. ID1734]